MYPGWAVYLIARLSEKGRGMSNGSRKQRRRAEAMRRAALQPIATLSERPAPIASLYDAMQEGNEYQSIVDQQLQPGTNLMEEVVRGISEIERIRLRPCIVYVGNVVKKDDSGASGVDSSDDLPFREMVAKVPADQRSVDVLLATLGGSAQQVSNFVNCLRARFDEVHFLIPSFCMSAGTLFALSGDHIWMTERACLGPIDPQVPTAGGRYVPAQALLLLLAEIQRIGDEAVKNGQPVPWAYVRVIDSLDKKELGEAITASQYSHTMAAQFLQRFKFRHWTVRESSQVPITEQDRAARANEIAAALGSHDRWKSHGHSLSRDVLWNELRLRIDNPDATLERAIVRMWAVLTYIFDKTPIVKMLCSMHYRYARHVQVQIVGPIRGPQR